MKIIVSFWLIVLAMAMPHALSAQTPAPQQPRKIHIHITATLERVTIEGSSLSHFYLLWNRRIRARPLGHAFSQCQRILRRTFTCTSIFILPLGKITTMGSLHGFDRYSVVITGGTKRYVGAAGTLDTWREGPGTYTLIFALEP